MYFLLECFTKKGGFAKFPIAKDQPDILHTLYATAALSLDYIERSKLEDKQFLKEMSG
jgi:prenyltransferase beta subunit